MVIGLRTAPICISFVGSWTEQHNRTTVDDIMGKSEYERERERQKKAEVPSPRRNKHQWRRTVEATARKQDQPSLGRFEKDENCGEGKTKVPFYKTSSRHTTDWAKIYLSHGHFVVATTQLT